jgi:hypothetical protein
MRTVGGKANATSLTRMNKFFQLLFLLSLFNNYKVFADATPFKNNEHIDIIYKPSNKLKFDSCGIIYRNYQTNELDTFFHCQGAECVVVDTNYVRLVRPIPDTFKVIFYFKNKILTSPELNDNGLNSYHQLVITDTEIKDITPIFKTTYSNYLIALLSTILLELLVALIYFFRHKIQLSNLRYIVYINLLTHPILWIISANITGFTIGNLIGEPIVLFIEALFLYRFIIPKLTINKSITLSFQMNLTSFIIGGLIYFLASS